MSSTADAAQMNNDGVRLLGNGEATESFQCFQQALTMLRASVVADTHPMQDSSSWCFASGFQKQGHCIVKIQNGHYFVFCRAFLFSSHAHEESHAPHLLSNSNSNAELSYPFLVFNLALTCHHSGKKLGSRDFMDRANLLYGLLMRVLSGQACAADSALKFLASIAINNAAVLQFELGHHDECTKLFRAMEVQLVVSDIHLDAYLLNGEATELRLNVQHAGQPLSLAPAA